MSITPALAVHGAVPLSKPGLPRSCVAVFETVTLTVEEVPTLFAASYAFESRECEPFAAAVVSQLQAYGDVVSVDFRAPAR